jgi:hypothetical protein
MERDGLQHSGDPVRQDRRDARAVRSPVPFGSCLLWSLSTSLAVPVGAKPLAAEDAALLASTSRSF